MSNNVDLNKVTINGVEYVRADSIPSVSKVTGKRAVVVLDRGWIYAGDVTDENGRIKLSRAVHVLSWSSIGFYGMIANPKSSNVNIKPIPNGVDAPSDSELFRIPVDDNWGV
jgi:hypothetical protein